MRKERYIIAGGGTGGHIFPGIAVANEIKSLRPQAEVIFVGSHSGLEAKIVPKYKLELRKVSIGKLNYRGGVLAKFKTLLLFPMAFLQCLFLLLSTRPKSLLGVGGFASGPVLAVATLLRIPTAIWEANVKPGMTNRILARFVDKVFLVFASTQDHLPAKNSSVVGLPVRAEIAGLQRSNTKPENINNDFNILVLGGSQGSMALNAAVMASVASGGDWLNRTKIVHQTGVADFARVNQFYSDSKTLTEFGGQAQAKEFLFDMDQQYARADLIISRSGANTMAEVAAAGRVAIFVPLPSAADNHQQINAEYFEKNRAGYMLLQKDLNAHTLIEFIKKIKFDPQLRQDIAAHARSLFVPDAGKKMASEMVAGFIEPR